MTSAADAAPGLHSESSKIVVLACGNTLRGDDGVGWRVASLLIEDPPCDGLEVILTQQLLPEHAEIVSGADPVVFLDCSAMTPAGMVNAVALEPAASLPGIFTHQIDPAALLRLAWDLYGRSPSRAVAIIIGGECFALNEELSASVGAAIPTALAAIRSFLAR